EVTSSRLWSVVLWVITPECHRVVMYIERLFNVHRGDRGKLSLGQPPGKFHNGPRASAVINIMIQPDNNTFRLEQIQCRRVLMQGHRARNMETSTGGGPAENRERRGRRHRLNSSEYPADPARAAVADQLGDLTEGQAAPGGADFVNRV